MNNILYQIKTIMEENIKTYLNDITLDQLEEAGAIFYMNGNNGTEFDWYVNRRLSYFMVFYDDEENMGAAKLSVHSDGNAELFLYGKHGQELVKEITFQIEANPQELLELAVTLKMVADEMREFDSSISEFNLDDLDTENLDELVTEFKENAEFYEETIARRDILSKTAIVSKKVVEEGWKVGIMTRSEPSRETDSGWYFGAGNESKEYLDNADNFALAYIGYIWSEIDADIIGYVTSPGEVQFIRVSSTEFEVDDNKREIFCEKREF